MTKFKNNTTSALVEALVVTDKTTAHDVRIWMNENGDRYEDHFIVHAAGIVMRGENNVSVTARKGDVILFDEDDEYSVLSSEEFNKNYTDDSQEEAPVKKPKKKKDTEEN